VKISSTRFLIGKSVAFFKFIYGHLLTEAWRNLYKYLLLANAVAEMMRKCQNLATNDVAFPK
jgi:hypothetical protein